MAALMILIGAAVVAGLVSLGAVTLANWALNRSESWDE